MRLDELDWKTTPGEGWEYANLRCGSVYRRLGNGRYNIPSPVAPGNYIIFACGKAYENLEPIMAL